MITLIYNLTQKGLLKALSFLLASGLFIVIFCKSMLFASKFGIFSLVVFYGTVILWIHGIGFEIRLSFWRLVFLPLVGYLIVIPAFIYIVLI
ncbi:cyd operon protein YbgE [Nicoletella semolina]|uniref:Cyd operon protein YbgE n=1 Tax=Nicoletella semolina TaxID=271160 RepID=A0A4R2NCN4_9PAST|nr:cyd operon YbgE family protein [Nicoletella semolina]MDH2924197.1 cytochrome bd biosynthesis protein [Nicoletella semolina]TCP18907.1 cyd operon protein YbgE [Nicoletella semolina]